MGMQPVDLELHNGASSGHYAVNVNVARELVTARQQHRFLVYNELGNGKGVVQSFTFVPLCHHRLNLRSRKHKCLLFLAEVFDQSPPVRLPPRLPSPALPSPHEGNALPIEMIQRWETRKGDPTNRD